MVSCFGSGTKTDVALGAEAGTVSVMGIAFVAGTGTGAGGVSECEL